MAEEAIRAVAGIIVPDDRGDRPMEAVVESAWECIKDHLESERHRICEEIKTYPRPIPACDVQFNALLEERTGVFEELRRIHEICFGNTSGNNAVMMLHDFIQSTRFLDDEAKQQINACLKERLSDLSSIGCPEVQALDRFEVPGIEGGQGSG